MSKDIRASLAPAQLRLPLGRGPSFDRKDFIVSESNREAAAAVDAWPNWPEGRLVLIGAEGVGKSHLARDWAARTGASVIDVTHGENEAPPAGPVLFEDVDRRVNDKILFHLLNRSGVSTVLLTARTPPRLWPASLPDLRSRLNALLPIEIAPPDDAVLRGVLRKFFRDRNIRPDDDVLSFLVRRIERSIPAALDVVRRLDEAADAAGRGVTRALAREVLGTGDESLDLFE